MAHIFVSYKSETEKQALNIVQQLENAGVDCWIACRDIPLGTDYIDEIPLAIEESPFFLLLLSKNMHISPWVKLELKQAISSGKHVLPLMIEDFKLHPSYRFMLQNYQIYPFFRDTDEVFQELLTRIHKVIPIKEVVTATQPQKPHQPAPRHNVVPYSGDEPYIFVSYAHKDQDRVMPMIQLLQQKGFKVWIDTGIEAGTEWSASLADRLSNCGCVLSFVSENYQNSHACRSELHFALNRQKPILPVLLEELQMSPGLQMQMSTKQLLFRYRHENDEAFVDMLAKAAILEPCRN